MSPRVPAAIAAALLAAVSLAGSAAATPLGIAAMDLPGAADNDPVGGPGMGSSGLLVDRPAAVPAPPAFAAVCYLLANAETGDVLLAKCPHTRALPASTLKTLTALALIPKLDKNRVVAATAEDANQDGTKVGVVAGNGYTVDRLFAGLLITSGNDAAWALARTYGYDATIEEMNRIARDLGAYDTVAKNPSGLDAPGQTTSAYDLALIGRAALANPQIMSYVGTKRTTFPGKRTSPSSRPTYEIGSHNRLLWNYPGTIGIKNGYTAKAKRTYIGAVRRGSTTYLLTYVANTNGTWRESAALYDWAFANGAKLTPVGRLVAPGEAAQPDHDAPSLTQLPADASAPPAPARSATTEAATTPPSEPSGPDRVRAAGENVAEQARAHPDWLLYGGVGAALVVAGSLYSRARTSRARATARRRRARRGRH